MKRTTVNLAVVASTTMTFDGEWWRSNTAVSTNVIPLGSYTPPKLDARDVIVQRVKETKRVVLGPKRARWQ